VYDGWMDGTIAGLQRSASYIIRSPRQAALSEGFCMFFISPFSPFHFFSFLFLNFFYFKKRISGGCVLFNNLFHFVSVFEKTRVGLCGVYLGVFVLVT